MTMDKYNQAREVYNDTLKAVKLARADAKDAIDRIDKALEAQYEAWGAVEEAAAEDVDNYNE